MKETVSFAFVFEQECTGSHAIGLGRDGTPSISLQKRKEFLMRMILTLKCFISLGKVSLKLDRF